MAVKGSKKSSKSMKPIKKPAPPAEHHPVKQIAEVPIALVEIGDLAKQIHDLIGSNWSDQQLYLNSEKIMILARSCTQVMKTEGLTKLRLDEKDSKILLQALRLYGRYDELTEIEDLRIRQLIEILVLLTESSQYYELVATVNNLPKTNSEAAAEQVEGWGIKPRESTDGPEWIGTQPPDGVRSCRVCGCTDDNCRQCFEKTGHPCHWVETDLCSACVTENQSSGVIAEG